MAKPAGHSPPPHAEHAALASLPASPPKFPSLAALRAALCTPLQRALADARARGSQRLLIACSGGADSAVLLRLAAPRAARLGLALGVVHVHHGLAEQADTWAAEVAALAAQVQVPCWVHRVRVADPRGQGIEAVARQARHRALRSRARQWQAHELWLAHHRDDQAETVLQRLARGTGPLGLAAMRPLEVEPSLLVRRPWLGVSGETIRAFARQQGWDVALDPSNHDPALARGWLRLQVLPALESHWPGARAALARLADQSAELSELTAIWLHEQLQALINDDGSVSLTDWRSQPDVAARWLLRAWLERQHLVLPAARLHSLCNDLRALPVRQTRSWVLGTHELHAVCGRLTCTVKTSVTR